jgi:pilus assembly protein Flp/PilA
MLPRFRRHIGAEESRARHRQEFLMRGLLLRFLRDEFGATAIEYCLIASGIALAIVVTVQGIGPQLNTKFTSINTSLK